LFKEKNLKKKRDAKKKKRRRRKNFIFLRSSLPTGRWRVAAIWPRPPPWQADHRTLVYRRGNTSYHQMQKMAIASSSFFFPLSSSPLSSSSASMRRNQRFAPKRRHGPTKPDSNSLVRVARRCWRSMRPAEDFVRPKPGS